MKKQTSQRFLLAIRLIVSSIFFVFLFAAIFSAKVSAQETPSPVDKLDAPPPSSAPSAAPAAGTPAAVDGKVKAAPKGKKTTIDFEDQLIEGSRQKPELFYLLQNKDFNYKRLIRLREDFLPELRKSAEDIKGRSGSAQ